MSVITDTWQQLVRRNLWPVALLLLVALAAVPVVLAKDPEAIPPAPAPAGGTATLATAPADPIVALAGAEDRAKRRRVLGARKDPFAPAPASASRASAASGTTASGSEGAGSSGSSETSSSGSDSASGSGSGSGSGSAPGSGSGPGGGSGSTGGSPPSAQPDPAPPTPGADDDAAGETKPTYELYSLTVRFGETSETSDGLSRRTLKRLEPLPSVEAPSLVYLGVLQDEKTAVFLVDANVTPDGDGECKPRPTSCETIQLREGETEFLDVKDETGTVVEQYQLDVVRIHRKTTASASTARRAYAREAKAGRKALQASIAARGPLRVIYDRERGTLRRLSAKAHAALVARLKVVDAQR